MTEPAVTVEGDERLAATARQAADDLAEMDSANRAIAEVVKARAAGNAPRVSGRLAGSVRASVETVEVVVSSDLVYAPVINFGWSGHNIVAQPFMTNALREAQSYIVGRYADDTNKAMRQVKGA